MPRWKGASTKQRGYAGPHQKLRAQWAPLVDAGQVSCHETICVMPSRWIQPGTPWHLAHTPDASGYRGPAHQRCNLAEANRRRAGRQQWQPARWVTSRSW